MNDKISVEKDLAWEVELSSTSQEIPCILWHLKVHYHVHKSLPHVPILRQMNPVHTLPSYILKILF